MKVLDLQCASGHVFEGWFASHEDFAAQHARGLLSCPVCNDAQIIKRLSAPRLNLGTGAPPAAGSGTPAGQGAQVPAERPGPTDQPTVEQNQAAWMKMVRHVLTHTEDVGKRFAQEALRIHQGQAPERGIRGQATREETEALLEEGIEILPLPMPAGLKEPLQ